jgi:hypothetical protein
MMKEILDNSKPTDLSELQKFPSADELTPLKMNYFHAYDEMLQKTKFDDPVLISEFQMYYLCSMLLGIIKLVRKSGMTKTCADNIILYFLNFIIASEKLFSAAKAARLAALQATQKVDVYNDANLVDNGQSRMYDSLVDPDYEDKFGFENMDYDGTNDDINT